MFTAPLEAHKQPLLIVQADAGASIKHINAHHIRIPERPNLDRSSLGVAAGIVEHLLQSDFKMVGIDEHERQILGNFNVQIQPFLRDRVALGAQAALKHIANTMRLQLGRG